MIIGLKGTSKMVKEILITNPQCRNSDDILYLHIIRKVGAEKGLDIDKMSIPMLLLHCRDLCLPSYESVSRARRKVQECYPDLKGNDNVQAFRELNEETYRAFAREVHSV